MQSLTKKVFGLYLAVLLSLTGRVFGESGILQYVLATEEEAYEVQYIGNVTGGGIIDTGLYGNNDLCVSIDIDKLDLTHDVDILGGTPVWSDTTKNFIIIDKKQSENKSYMSIGPNGWLNTYTVNARLQKYRVEPTHIRIWRSDVQGWTINVVRRSATFSTQITMPLFSAYGTPTPDISTIKGTKMRILGRVYFYSRSTGLPIKTLVPYCKNGVPCYYDEVNNNWLYEINGNGFYCGPRGTYNEATYVPD